MPTLAVYVNGMTMGTAGRNAAPSKRGEVNGWSRAAVRRHTKWLYSVDSDALDGTGFAMTLTMADIPASSVEFHAARRAFLKRLERLGLVRLHWVVEWTRRRRPHLHMAGYFPPEVSGSEAVALRVAIVRAWIAVAERWGAGWPGQHVKPIDGAQGWLRYLSKHAARGVEHYQRQGKPEGWEKTGRLWGMTGEWPEHEPIRLELSRQGAWALRRLVRSWRVADAREALRVANGEHQRRAALRRLSSARTMLACNRRDLSEVRGTSEWAPESVVAQLVWHLQQQGHLVHQSE